MTGWRWWLVVGFTATLVFLFLWRRPPVAATPSSTLLTGSSDFATRAPV
jgi:hypothetical protein